MRSIFSYPLGQTAMMRNDEDGQMRPSALVFVDELLRNDMDR